MRVGLRKRDLGPDPIAALKNWLDEAARGSGLPHPEAMTLCTVGADGWPQGRIVLLKGVDARGLRFFTNSRSEKGRALERNPRAEAVFHWDPLKRHVRGRGSFRPLSDAEANAYFMSRILGSRLAAWASRQSEPVADRAALEARLAAVEKEFEGKEVPRPPHWWGYLIAPERIEFWQEGLFRFHDRFVYRLGADGWTLERLNP